MKKKERQLRKTIIALHQAGVPVEKLARDAPKELGVRPRFVFRVLGYRKQIIRFEGTRRLAWVKQ